MIHGRPSSMYSLTKGAFNSFTKALVFEMGPHEVRVNAISPVTVNTPLVQSTLGKYDTNYGQAVFRRARSSLSIGAYRCSRGWAVAVACA